MDRTTEHKYCTSRSIQKLDTRPAQLVSVETVIQAGNRSAFFWSWSASASLRQIVAPLRHDWLREVVGSATLLPALVHDALAQ